LGSSKHFLFADLTPLQTNMILAGKLRKKQTIVAENISRKYLDQKSTNRRNGPRYSHRASGCSAPVARSTTGGSHAIEVPGIDLFASAARFALRRVPPPGRPKGRGKNATRMQIDNPY
jgi:hypothetical protein